MTATIDFGNTTTKIAFFEGNEIIAIKKTPSSDILNVESLFDFEIRHKAQPTTIIACSVTRSTEELEAILKPLSVPFLILTPTTKIPIQKNYDTPETLGADRLAAAVGANYLFPNQNVLIVDIGTAIKYDYVSAGGIFEGGIISAGMRIRFEALHTFTKRLPLVSADGIPSLIGKNTKSCIQSGVVHGIAAEMNGIIKKYKELGDCQVILCGGDASFFESTLECPYFAEPNLVFIGLNQLSSRV